ncbi:MAG: response regulator [Candidatus Obscuribacterales bacterium]|nr:response regulator [Candidatus Obscuribacterales bacterium]
MFENIFHNSFMPHGVCLRWNGPLLAIFIAGNLGIAIAYFIIPAALRYFIGQRKDLPYPHMFKLFAAFILSCGLTHIMKVWTLYQPLYWVEASLDLWTAGVSMVTAVLLFPLIPQALRLRAPAELESINKQLQSVNEEMAKLNEQYRIARDQAIESSELKSTFIANVSHELRTPLAGILGMNELLLQKSSLNEDDQLCLKVVQDSAKSLLVLVNDLLDLSKIEAGKMKIDSVPLDPVLITNEAVQVVSAAAKAKNIELTVESPVGLPPLIGDPIRVSQVLINLIGNAVKFTPKGSVKVVLKVEEDTEQTTRLRFSVTDTGIGIAKDDQKRLFSPFSQVDSSGTRQYGGAGLGLNISKRLVELMGGTIGFDSELETGSTFWFAVNFQKQTSHKLVPLPGDQERNLVKGRILVVEDNKSMQLLTGRQLNKLGYQYTMCSSAEAAMQELNQDPSYALILMDCHLPGISGFEATVALRAQEASASRPKHLPVIAMTAAAMKGDTEKCLQSGMDDYLSKPYTLEQLKQKLELWIASDG